MLVQGDPSHSIQVVGSVGSLTIRISGILEIFALAFGRSRRPGAVVRRSLSEESEALLGVRFQTG